jgi:Fur family transcriptional regulator, ferric uptake regulator
MPDVQAILQRLEHEGYRLTGPRRRVLEEVVGRHEPFTSAELLETVQRDAPTIGRATVFRTLDLLSRLGVVQRIHSDAEYGPCHAYLACDDSHHHHLICNRCGTVLDFSEDGGLEALVREVERRTAFRVEGHRLELTGTCARCQVAEGHTGDS